MEATKTLVSSLVLTRLDYCNALLAGCPQVLLDKIQRVINCSARLISTKLQLNDDKTEILLTGSAPGLDLPSSVRVGQSNISFSSAAHNLGVIFYCELALRNR